MKKIKPIIFAIAIWLAFPFLGSLFDCGGPYEQQWLDDNIKFLKVMRENCTDEDLCEVLNYTIIRYNKIGPWDVSVQYIYPINPNLKAIGINCPWCPGIIIDREVLDYYNIKGSAVLLCHEALHDWYPYFGHNHINDRELKLRILANKVYNK